MLSTYSVGELTAYIRDMFAQDVALQDVWVEGEISNLTRAQSGHIYFTLKDSSAQLACAMWRSTAERLTVTLRSGDAVIAHGYIGVYEQKGAYQFYVDRVRPVGLGDLYARFEQLKNKLDAEGLFAPERKRPIPALPRQIGVVTSADAAAFQDVQNVLRRRFPAAQVILSACLVQGADAPPQIVAAIERLNRYTNADVIIVCRGGGSIEDLWAFNDERVARAIAASRIPVIAGVGHETDFTIADFAADLRAPTPSAAAEIATPDIVELRGKVSRMRDNLRSIVMDTVDGWRETVREQEWSLKQVSPAVRISNLRQRLDDWNLRMDRNQRGRVALLRERLAARRAMLHAASPQAILERGYAIVTRRADGERISAPDDAPAGTSIEIRLASGTMTARTE